MRKNNDLEEEIKSREASIK